MSIFSSGKWTAKAARAGARGQGGGEGWCWGAAPFPSDGEEAGDGSADANGGTAIGASVDRVCSADWQ